MRLAVVALSGVILVAPGGAEARPLRVLSLDQCADQYVLALAPDADLALSPRADDPDAWMRDAAAGRRRVRPTLEAAIAFQPDVVVRYWGGEPRLLSRLEADGARVLTIDDATDFNGVRADIRKVSIGLGAANRGEALIARMDATLPATSAHGGTRPRAQYLTPGGFTAGKGTLIDAILFAAGFANAAEAPFFAPVSIERMVLVPPARFVLGFFDQSRDDWRGAGRHPVLQRLARGRVAARLPAAALTCPGWFAADAAAMLKAGA
ncbi:ABC transporter substrate-binding protein [Brevundimonas sp. Root1423]|uniref:ABC transporter substrate-binding protein n=1 Tax=Brevundimonas sp. Root1423 TaxID=1736462 RepID=UPI0006F4CA61|nr:ABC transporter substrate-binding protein [Brevundimonas sp. Root1423]KQY75057.1 iron ABC transporter substrate-binding protein [Brevundimonas sp. Root1423]